MLKNAHSEPPPVRPRGTMIKCEIANKNEYIHVTNSHVKGHGSTRRDLFSWYSDTDSKHINLGKVDFGLVKRRKKVLAYSSFSVDSFWASDCRISIFTKSSFLKSLATLRTVGLGTPSSLTTLV